MRKRLEPRLVWALDTASASPAHLPPPSPSSSPKPPRPAAPFLAVLFRRGRADAAALLNRRLRGAPVPEARSLLSALPDVCDAVSYNTVLAALCRQRVGGGDHLHQALSLLADMSQEAHPDTRPNAVSDTMVMRGLCASRRTGEAVALLRSMQASASAPTSSRTARSSVGSATPRSSTRRWSCWLRCAGVVFSPTWSCTAACFVGTAGPAGGGM